MSTRRRGPISSKTLLTRLAFVCLVQILAGASTDSPRPGQNAPQRNEQPASLQVVILLDINPNQRKVFLWNQI